MKTPEEILREMRQEFRTNMDGEAIVGVKRIRGWADALEASMREPFAWWVEYADGYGKWETGGYAVRFKPDTDRPGRTVAPLFAFPLDAATVVRLEVEHSALLVEEIERLKRYADAVHADKMDALLKIDLLRDALQSIVTHQRSAAAVIRIADAALAKEDKP